MKYRKKPVVVDAIRYVVVNGEVVIECHPETLSTDSIMLIHTLEGIMHATPGDWIIRGVKGKFYPCKPDIFEITY